MPIEGKKIQQEILDEIGSKLQGKSVVFLQFGENKVSEKYVAAKIKVAKKLGVLAEHIISNAKNTEEALIEVISYSRNIDGIVVQLPLPKNLDEKVVLSYIPKEIDIDVLNEASKNSMLQSVAGAVYRIIKKNVEDHNKNIVILGKGSLVGRPVSELLNIKKIPHKIFDKDSDKESIESALLSADVIICGMGAPHFLKPEMIKVGVVLIDAGTSEQGGVLLGDVDPECYSKARAYTPVPGGIGPITLAILFENMVALRA